MRFTLATAIATLLPLALAEVSHPELAARGASQWDIDNALRMHNEARAAVGQPPLVWDNALQASAQAWADQLVAKGTLVHSGAGENLYWSSAATDHDLQLATQSWINEKPNWHGEKIPDGDFGSYGHYTQVTWHDTQRVGMGALPDANGGVYVVAHYDPVGNWVGQKPY